MFVIKRKASRDVHQLSHVLATELFAIHTEYC